MGKQVIWTRQSLNDLEKIFEYIASDSIFYASSFLDKLITTGESLEYYSERGRVVPEILKNNIREVFLKDYRIIYRVSKTNIEILTIIHGRRIFRGLKTGKSKRKR